MLKYQVDIKMFKKVILFVFAVFVVLFVTYYQLFKIYYLVTQWGYHLSAPVLDNTDTTTVVALESVPTKLNHKLMDWLLVVRAWLGSTITTSFCCK